MSNHTMLSTAIAVAIAFTGSSAIAETAEAGHSVPVRFGDLNLTTDQGLATLKRRIANAAANACGAYDIRDLTSAANAKACRDFAMNNAAPEVELAVAAARKGESYASSSAAINLRTR